MSKDTNKKIVLSVCDISPFKMGSFEEFLVNFTSILAKNGFIHYIVFRDFPISSVEQALLNEGALIIVKKRSQFSIINFYNISSLIKEIRPDIVHFHFYPMYSLLNYVKFLFNVKIVYTDHMGGKRPKSKMKKTFRKYYYYLNFLLFDMGIDRIICVSDFVKLKYSKDYGIQSGKLCVIYNGIDVKKFYKMNDVEVIKNVYCLGDGPIISCVGMRKDKGPHYLLQSIPLILAKVPNTKFIFIGEGECKDYLDSMIDKLMIKDTVIFAGNVDNLCDIYNISSIVAIPSIFEEAFCFVAAEAMATETTVVAFDSGAIKEVLYNPNCIVPKDHIQLASKIIEMLSSVDDTESLRSHVANKFSLESNINKHLKLYDYLLSE